MTLPYRAWRIAVWLHRRHPRRWTWELRWRIGALSHANPGTPLPKIAPRRTP